jgi:hypothetical protein
MVAWAKSETLLSKITRAKRAGGMAKSVECLFFFFFLEGDNTGFRLRASHLLSRYSMT